MATAPIKGAGARHLRYHRFQLSVATHVITASYGRSNTVDSSSSSSPITIQVAAPAPDEGTSGPSQTTTNLTSSLAQPVAGQNVTFTAAVASQGGSAMPTGIVTFLDGSATLGSAVLAGGSASFSTANLPQGTNLITAVYSGDALDLVSISQVVTVVVTAPAPPQAPGAPAPPQAPTAPAIVATTATLTVSATQVTAGQPVSLNASVTPQSGGGIPTGTVTFLDGQTTLGTGTLNGAGNATLNATSLATGTHSIALSATAVTRPMPHRRPRQSR